MEAKYIFLQFSYGHPEIEAIGGLYLWPGFAVANAPVTASTSMTVVGSNFGTQVVLVDSAVQKCVLDSVQARC